MPVDRDHSRFGRRAVHGSLGDPSVWDCPACGAQNSGRRPEQGCEHCGAGDPLQSRAGSPVTGSVRPGDDLPAGIQPRVSEPARPAPVIRPEGQRLYRLIEYALHPGADISEVLRRSLVGSLPMQWGTLTGVIVDTLDPQQEDRLKMARLQPGVWLAHPEAIHEAPRAPQQIVVHPAVVGRMTFRESNLREAPQMITPDTGVPYPREIADGAASLLQWFGPRFCYTLSLALSNVAPELAAIDEPERFLPMAECQQWAQALLDVVPPEAAPPGPPEAPPSSPEEAQRIAATQQRLREGAVPMPVFREDGKGLGGL